ncbi:Gfo/Idh/MocA family oxidoreductase [Albimonas sp. CAU 1670]|uniref:Gfo/Idh/MocA family protein n=1 Tax=Albimonas sp. CAU 1670 TaxID=3032599 RepID=UPI0023DB5CD5|nr:Gfo/Idh/MocA family oxidoreductase [Albimonas sp. CAU 1670]MDF2231886.1 Gfo/Idh/MocA family oxidoreductase [Albimonas sp. CAU 1670]
MSAPVPVVVLGAGRDGLRQARLIADCAALELKAVVDPADSARERAEEMGFPTAGDVEDAPAGVVAAVIAQPATSRAPAAEEAAARGWATLTDRTLAVSLRDGRRILDAFDRAGAPLLVGHHRRHHPAVAAAREAAQGGLLGRLVAADAVWLLRRPDDERSFAWKVRSGAGAALTQLANDVDLLRWLMGEIASVSAIASRATPQSSETDSAGALLHFSSGALATALMSSVGLSPWGWEAGTGDDDEIARSGEDCLRLVGSEGSMSLPSLTYWRHGGAGKGDWTRPPMRLSLPSPMLDARAAQLDHFAQVARGEVEPLVSGPDALRTLAAALAVEESARTGKVLAPDPDRPDAWEPTAASIFRNLSAPDPET